LVGVEREVAVEGYVVALRTLFVTAAVVATVAVVLQAGTGRRAGGKEMGEEDEEENVQIHAGGQD
jgi:hypothetical protein